MASGVIAGLWQVILDLQVAAGAGPNVVTVIVRHKNPSCTLIATLFTDTATMTEDSLQEYTFEDTIAAVNFADEDTLEIDIEQTTGSEQIRIHYDGSASGGADSRILLPGASSASRRIVIGD